MLYPNHHASYHQNVDQSSEQEESSCSQCKRNTYGIREEEEEDESSVQVPMRKNTTESSSEDEPSVPLRKNVVQKNYQFEEMLKLLQYEVDSLKKQNQTKDLTIRQLKFQVHKSTVEEERKMQSTKQAYEVHRLRQELGCSPRNNFQMSANGFKSASFQHSQPIQSYQNGFTLHSQNYNTPYQIQTKHKPTSQQAFIETMRPKVYEQMTPERQANYELRITRLEKQIREYQLELLQQKQRLGQLEEETKWQQKFIHSFVKMCDQLSLNYGEKLKLNRLGDDLKRKTKICWNYMKNLIGYFIQNNELAPQIVENG